MIDHHLVQIAQALILPPGGLVVLALLGLLLSRRFLGKLLLLLSLASLYLLSTPYTAAWLMASLERDLALPPETHTSHGAQAIVTSCQQCVRTMMTYVRRNKVPLEVLDITQLIHRALKRR